jgi:2,4-dienoyl-CoA reductase (NADPH2)
MLFTQFLSPAINRRKDDYGGSLENRARFAVEVIRAIRAEVGDDFCLGFKISVDEAPRELLPWLRKGNRIDDVAGPPWPEEAGSTIHVSAGDGLPYPEPGSYPSVTCDYDSLSSAAASTTPFKTGH